MGVTVAADIEIIAAYCEALDEDGEVLAAFAASDDPDDGYALFRLDGARLWLEVSDEIFGAHDALEAITVEDARIALVIRPAQVARLGMIRSVEIRPAPGAEDWAEAVALLRRMIPAA